ncbi:hypothetical protein EVAR_9258_1 [Eumeta japonica]|uniref:PiggyBac transposable element-derived protein domain-containing protein n=1 Tax=Eumeta variegata TaxID=151549 RepID=A0A4C1TMV1_EUMVA|nr:hypothetical protein EVAR_9258_1 [Eumeta japonica]
MRNQKKKKMWMKKIQKTSDTPSQHSSHDSAYEQECDDATERHEMLENFRGRCKFRQYIPRKPGKHGIKIFALTDARTYYTFNMEIYAGLQPTGPYFIDDSVNNVVKRIIELICNSDRNIKVDNSFTNVALAEDLVTNHKLTIVGTVKKNKPETPLEFKSKVCLLFSLLFRLGNSHTTLLSYVPKRKENE